jgi:hypothetical protein
MHGPAVTERRSRVGLVAALVLLLAFAAWALVGMPWVGGGSAGDAAARDLAGAGVASVAPPATVRTSRCADWLSATPHERRELLAGFREFFGGAVDSSARAPGARGTTLSDREATTLFDTRCRPAFAATFRLYMLYARAAGFTAGAGG